jgi:two-component system, oxyanion-binding sensor
MSVAGEFRLGYLALTDAAPLLVADRLGLFAAEGLTVQLSREASWATLRDRLAAGLLDGAHMLAALGLATRLGLGGGPAADLIAPLALNAHGAAVTLSPDLAALVLEGAGEDAPSAAPLRAMVRARRQVGAPPLSLGVVYPISTHAHLLRDWLAAGGVEPDADVRLRVLPPTDMVAALQRGWLDGFCVGAPWSAVAENLGAGRRVLDIGQLAPFGPDKVFAVSEAWAARNPAPLQALLRALVRAARWADTPANRAELISLLHAVTGAPKDALAADLDAADPRRRLVFAANGVSRPDPAHMAQLVASLRRWNGLDPAQSATGFYRPDLHDQAVATLVSPAP